jgi:hypothetical protein
MACIHGFAPSDCLICSTLQAGDKGRASPTVQTAARPAETPMNLTTAPPRPVSSRHESGGSADLSRTHGRTFTHVLAVLAVIVVVVIGLDLGFHIIAGIIHALELAAVAAVAAVIGYGVGRAHGRRPKGA